MIFMRPKEQMVCSLHVNNCQNQMYWTTNYGQEGSNLPETVFLRDVCQVWQVGQPWRAGVSPITPAIDFNRMPGSCYPEIPTRPAGAYAPVFFIPISGHCWRNGSVGGSACFISFIWQIRRKKCNSLFIKTNGKFRRIRQIEWHVSWFFF